MAVYENRLLFRQTRYDENNSLVALESTWAYTIQLLDSVPIPGRYRCRILNVDFVDPDNMTSIGTQLVCVLEKWTNEGWIECLEYMPTSSSQDFYSIEDELNMMFKSFTTGVRATDEFYSPPPSTPPPYKKKTPPPKKEPTPTPPVSDVPKSDPPDFEWI